jgi:glucokinase
VAEPPSSPAPDSPGAESVALAIDLGGTNSRVAAVTADCEIVARIAHDTRADEEPDAVIADLARAVAEIREQISGRSVVGLGVAAPGPLDPETGVVFQAPNLPQWHNVPLADDLQQLTGLPVYIGNDANLAALAEARHGAGRGASNLIFLTVSTGVGSGILAHGRLVLGEHGVAAEAGHMTISMDGPLCMCGNRGCLEAYASGTSLVNRARAAMAAGRASTLARLGHDLDAKDIEQAADGGDALAQELIEEAGTALGYGVRNLLHLFNPTVVVIGGGVSRIGPRLWDPMWRVIRADAMPQYQQDVRIVPAALGDDMGLIGAALLVHEAELHHTRRGARSGPRSSTPGRVA